MPVENFEDNILYQTHQLFPEGLDLHGDHLWRDYYGKFWNSMDWQDYPIELNEELYEDAKVMERLLTDLGSRREFKLKLVHLIGMDGGGHFYKDLNSEEFKERVVALDTHTRSIIEAMDDKTTLLAFGDHGVATDGSHGGIEEHEIRTFMFAYQKKPFPMHEYYAAHKDEFFNVDHRVKVNDFAATVSLLMDQSFPFSNMGIAHPAFAPYNDLKKLFKRMLQNLEQMSGLVREYCDEYENIWCTLQDSKVLALKVEELKKVDVSRKSDKEILDLILQMHEFGNG